MPVAKQPAAQWDVSLFTSHTSASPFRHKHQLSHCRNVPLPFPDITGETLVWAIYQVTDLWEVTLATYGWCTTGDPALLQLHGSSKGCCLSGRLHPSAVLPVPQCILQGGPWVALRGWCIHRKFHTWWVRTKCESCFCCRHSRFQWGQEADHAFVSCHNKVQTGRQSPDLHSCVIYQIKRDTTLWIKS